MTEYRRHFRFPVKRLALLKEAGNTILCDVLDLTEQGLQLQTERPTPSEILFGLNVSWRPTPSFIVRLSSPTRPPHVGGWITDISAEDRQHLIHHIQELIAQNLESV